VKLSLSGYLVPIKIEKLGDGVYLATSDVLQGLVAQGRTVAETMEIAQDVARKLIESYIEHGDPCLIWLIWVLYDQKMPLAIDKTIYKECGIST
jgi:predicted RNase H-like HicB family nuclease